MNIQRIDDAINRTILTLKAYREQYGDTLTDPDAPMTIQQWLLSAKIVGLQAELAELDQAISELDPNR